MAVVRLQIILKTHLQEVLGCLTGIAAELKKNKWHRGLFPLTTYSFNSSLVGPWSRDAQLSHLL